MPLWSARGILSGTKLLYRDTVTWKVWYRVQAETHKLCAAFYQGLRGTDSILEWQNYPILVVAYFICFDNLLLVSLSSPI